MGRGAVRLGLACLWLALVGVPGAAGPAAGAAGAAALEDEATGSAAPDESPDEAAGEGRLTLRTTLKSSLLVSRTRFDPALPPERDVATSLWRLRLDARGRLSERSTGELAYEHRVRIASGGAGPGASILPSTAPAPFRIWQLDAALAEAGDTFSWRHELDRAFVATKLRRGELTVGRQAVGWGRGVLFSAVDVFAPFSPLEVDREWRRGIDAVRIEERLSDTSSLDAVAAFGESLRDSALLGRLRGYRGRVDGEGILGKRGRDLMAAGTLSAAVGDAEAHAELALFDTPEAFPHSGLLGNDHLVPKVLLGGSYTFNVGKGLTLLGEYHYSGFGAGSMVEAVALLQTPDYRQRFLRGDTQILGKQAVALQASYPLTGDATSAFLWLHSPQDGSGVLSPSLQVTLSDNVALAGNLFVPYGRGPQAGIPRSEYGSGGLSAFLQARLDY